MSIWILHHNDPDGYASAYIAYDFMRSAATLSLELDEEIYFHSMGYGSQLPKNLDYENDKVVMVDFSLQPLSEMVEFARKIPSGSFVWIDHHKTSLDMEEAAPELKAIAGIRKVVDDQDIPVAACELTWEFFHPSEEVPLGITLLGSWDTWRWEASKELQAKYLVSYCNSINCNPSSDEGKEFWSQMIHSSDQEMGWLTTKVLFEGEVIDRYMLSDYTKRIRGRGFTAKFAGYNAIVTNDRASSVLFESFRVPPEKVDLMVAFTLGKEGFWTVSLYSVQPHIDCGQIAKQLGEAGPIPSGGGHKGAAGFQCNWAYLESLIERT